MAAARPAAYPAQPRLAIRPCTLAVANTYVRWLHRHHQPVRGMRWALSVVDAANMIRGVAIAGRPVARLLDDGLSCEVLRVSTDGCPNACSALYGAVRRVARAMGYERCLTYTLAEEPGTSLRAAGWIKDGVTSGGPWSRPSRQRADAGPLGEKVRWIAWPRTGGEG
jgi:hypothetical protein